ncbi:hypothetical protein GCM10008171_27520 [Methylopila jiangsuensis]|uniref:Hypervirulence associated protein TUDOR domain-containing protein n=1 Tax=Methylopila jiangsuensis TaxID=586230 RepID=A0A9W6JL44_9HYPH|nr:DUF2945 domain-containing protein [Methylopila jiangsuensis]MDR6285115.1 hypothetical protein [Methylopila jiangsuensis]GLK77498.1 hypothetical protein GCM10008171_27520 [Methylopila jiangsuensis]
MTRAYAVGARVAWSWGKGEASGAVVEVFRRRVQRTIKGARIVRRASETNPAYLIEQPDGAKALKSHSELNADG